MERAQGWMYRNYKLGPFLLPYYASPKFQLLLVSMTCFLCPGMFNALSGMGGGGQISTTAANNANTALYSCFALLGFFAGTITNTLGVKTTLSLGGLGYCVYVASFLCYSHTENEGFVIFAGALLGVCAGLLWTAQGAIMMSYPSESAKGRYISWFWMIFNLGAVIGSLIPLGQNIHVTNKSTVTDGTYVAFIVLTALGAALAWCLVSSKDVLRADNSRVILIKNPTWRTEFIGLFDCLKTDYYIVSLFPMFWASNWFYTYQFNAVNHARFNTRTTALNNTLYWLSQIIGAFVFGYCLDVSRIRRSIRARVAWVALFLLTMIIWGGGYAFARGSTRNDPGNIIDWTSNYGGPVVLYMLFGFYDAAWQTCVYWFMGSLTNNSRKLANYAGWYKGIQSAGAAVIWRLDGLETSYMSEFASCWALLAGSLLLALPMLLFKIKDHVPIEDDIVFSDQTYAEVAPAEQKQKPDEYPLEDQQDPALRHETIRGEGKYFVDHERC